MNEKITFPRLATLLAERSGRSKRFSEDFLREFFALISERLEAGDSVKVKGLGTFRLSRVEPRKSVDVTTGLPMEISGHSKVVFIPSKELAEAVNAPFEAFTAIEIGDDADISQLFTKDEINLQATDESDEESEYNPHEHTVTNSLLERIPYAASRPEEDVLAQTQEPDGIAEAAQVPDLVDERTFDIIETEDQTDRLTEETDSEESSSDEEIVDRETIASPYKEDERPEIENKKETELPAVEDDQENEESEIDDEPDDVAPETEEETEDNASEDETESDIEDEFDTDEPRKKTWVKTLMISLGAAVIALFATFAVWYVFATNDFNRIFNRTATNSQQPPSEGFVVGKSASVKSSPTPIIVEDNVSDTLSAAEESEVPTAPSDAIVYDTISTTRYLTTMAKAHYGNFNLWPYIYEENKAILGHPDRIRPGTPVVIPKLSKYGVDPENKDDIEKAKKMGVEIYARHGKKI
ncbi:MAG: HU family DNA-binding protein [Muribaculaceae bacterium]|nr:HU family DNA-binding protein [Muribaculaceae bacterium]